MELHDLGDYQSRFLQLVNKAGLRQSFDANIYQRKLNEMAARNRNKPWRVLVLKCRQIGATTWGSSFIYHKTATQFDKNALIIADSDENSSGIFEKCKNYYAWSVPAIRPMKRYSNEKALLFNNPDQTKDDGLNSRISIATAGNMAAGRSKTIQYLHASEFAYWQNASQLTTGLFQSVPMLDNTAIIIESTANGVSGKGEEFYNRCMKALDGDKSFDFVFFDWKENPEYEIDPGPDFIMTDEEKELAARYPLYTPRKLMFRRYKIASEMGSALINPVDQWNQEYPDTPTHAFISSGRPVFEGEKLHGLISIARNTFNYRARFDAVSLVKDTKGEITIFKEPSKGEVYAIGADVAEGLEGGDFSTAYVLNKKMEIVATYCAHEDPDKFGALLVRLGKHYNNAILAPEVNNHGHAVIAAIKNLEYYYVYKRDVKEELGRELTYKIGWQTNTKTKMLMLDELVATIRDGSLVPCCEAVLREMLTLSIESDGNITLNSKDRVVALAIALQAIKQVGSSDLKAYVPTTTHKRDVTKMTLQEKLKYYDRMRKA